MSVFSSFFFFQLTCSQNITWGIERKRGKEVRISNEGYHALVTAESRYSSPPSLPVSIVLLSWHRYFQSDVLFDLYFNYFWASKRKSGSILNVIVEHAPKMWGSANTPAVIYLYRLRQNPESMHYKHGFQFSSIDSSYCGAVIYTAIFTSTDHSGFALFSIKVYNKGFLSCHSISLHGLLTWCCCAHYATPVPVWSGSSMKRLVHPSI